MTVKEALNTILNRIDCLKTEEVALLDALGRVTSEAIVAGRDHPPWDNSSMDGFAVRSEDTTTAPADLKVIEDIPAGYLPIRTVCEGEASQIMTGAPLPKGADAVVRVEDTVAVGPVHVKIQNPVSVSENIRFRGEDIKKGEVVIAERSAIGPAEIGMGATVGRGKVRVYQRPRVAILATGNELVDLGEKPGPHQISNTNTYSLTAQVRETGGIPVQLGIARDDPKDLLQKLEAGINCDLILISGGVSVGKYDFVKDVLSRMGFELSFWRVSMKPGHPLVFGSLKGSWVFGLPGNPVSTLVTFEQFVRPVLLKMAGYQSLFRPTVHAVLEEPITKKNDGKLHFVRAVVQKRDGHYSARSAGNQGSGVLSSMVKGNGLIILPEETERIEAGQSVVVQLMAKGLDRQAAPGF